VIKFEYKPDAGVLSLLETFRLMCNDAMRAALAKRPKNKFELIGLSHRRLTEYGLHSHYILSACEVAYSAYKNKKGDQTHILASPFSSSTIRLTN
jgi:hypothetical protein